MPPKSRFHQANNTRKHQWSNLALFVPRRCEGPTCTNTTSSPLRRCRRCVCVIYCSDNCQKADRLRHQVECKHLTRLAMWGLAYSEEEDLRRYPFELKGRVKKEYEEDCCGICGEKEQLTRTQCCGNKVCWGECKGLHKRYTMCGIHCTKGHTGDWRQCELCKKCEIGERDTNNRMTRRWHGLNGYCFTPMLERDIEKGSMITGDCWKCKKRVLAGVQHYGYGPVVDDVARSLPLACEKCMFT